MKEIEETQTIDNGVRLIRTTSPGPLLNSGTALLMSPGKIRLLTTSKLQPLQYLSFALEDNNFVLTIISHLQALSRITKLLPRANFPSQLIVHLL